MKQIMEISKKTHAIGWVKKAFGNLLQVEFEGNIRQGEVAMVHVGKVELKGEVIEIIGNEAKIQVFEDTKGVKLNARVSFTGDLLRSGIGTWLADFDF